MFGLVGGMFIPQATAFIVPPTFSDGVHDDAPIINATIAASPPGSTIWFPGKHAIGSTIILLENRTYIGPMGYFNGFTFQQLPGSNLPAVLASAAWYNNQSFCGFPIRMYNITIDGNKANNTTSHGIALTNFNSIIEECSVINAPAAGILIAANTRNNSLISNGLVQTRINRCVISAPGTFNISIQDSSHGKVTDGYLIENQLDTAGTVSVIMDTCGGWRIERNHVNSPQQDGIITSHCFNTFIRGNYIDGFGFNASASPGTFYNGILAQTLAGGPTIMTDNFVQTTSVVANTTFQFLSVQATDNTGANYITVANNRCLGQNVSNQNAFAFDGHLIGQSFIVSEWNNQASNFPAANVYSLNTNVTFGAIKSQNSIQTALHLGSFGATVAAAAGANAGASPPAPVVTRATDLSGTCTFGTGTLPAAGAQVVVTFASAYANAPSVVIVPNNSLTAALTLYVTILAGSFTVNCVNAPAASQGNTTYSFTYQVQGV